MEAGSSGPFGGRITKEGYLKACSEHLKVFSVRLEEGTIGGGIAHTPQEASDLQYCCEVEFYRQNLHETSDPFRADDFAGPRSLDLLTIRLQSGPPNAEVGPQ